MSQQVPHSWDVVAVPAQPFWTQPFSGACSPKPLQIKPTNTHTLCNGLELIPRMRVWEPSACTEHEPRVLLCRIVHVRDDPLHQFLGDWNIAFTVRLRLE